MIIYYLKCNKKKNHSLTWSVVFVPTSNPIGDIINPQSNQFNLISKIKSVFISKFKNDRNLIFLCNLLSRTVFSVW